MKTPGVLVSLSQLARTTCIIYARSAVQISATTKKKKMKTPIFEARVEFCQGK